MVKAKVVSVANQKSGIDKSTIGYNLGSSCHERQKGYGYLRAISQKILDQNKSHALELPLSNVVYEMVSDKDLHSYEEFM